MVNGIVFFFRKAYFSFLSFIIYGDFFSKFSVFDVIYNSVSIKDKYAKLHLFEVVRRDGLVGHKLR